MHRAGIQRLTALWALTECGLGGVLHAIHSPFTGLLVGGLSITYIVLIGYLAQRHRGADGSFLTPASKILNALLFVLCCKAVISPHSPLGAYFAVSVQGLIGAVLFTVLRNYKWVAAIAAPVTTTLSATQKIMVLWLLFGNTPFEAFNEFVMDVNHQLNWIPEAVAQEGAMWVALVFVGVYFIGGVVVGAFIVQIPPLLKLREKQLQNILQAFEFNEMVVHATKRKGRMRTLLFLLIIGVISLVITYAVAGEKAATTQLVRTFAILTLWFVVMRPLLSFFAKRWIQQRAIEHQTQITLISNNLPRFKSFATHAWRNAVNVNGWRLVNFVLLLLLFEPDHD